MISNFFLLKHFVSASVGVSVSVNVVLSVAVRVGVCVNLSDGVSVECWYEGLC